jgi:small-conductance mechanosensitive channel
MVQNKHLWQPEAQLPKDKPSEELATQLSKLMDHNQQLALQLAEMVAKTSRELEQNQKSMVQLSDILARTMQHNQHLATQLSEVTGHLKRQRRFLTPLPVLHFGDDEESWVRDGERELEVNGAAVSGPR